MREVGLLIAVLAQACGSTEIVPGPSTVIIVTNTVSVPTPAEEGAVPCPDHAASRCQAWWGVELSATVCFADETSSPQDADCLKVNPGLNPAIWCCPPPDTHVPGGPPFEEPTCNYVECPGGFDASAMCNAWNAGTDAAVGHCTEQDAFSCRPAGADCAVYAPHVVCCLD